VALSIAAVLLLLALQGASAGAVTITEFPIQPVGPAGTHRPAYITASPLGALWFADMGTEAAVRAIDTGGLPLATITDPEFVPGPDLGFAADGTLYWVINEPFVTGLGQRSPSGVVTISDNNDVKEGSALAFSSTGVATYTARHKSPAYWALCTNAGCSGSGTEEELTDLTLGPEGSFWGPSEDKFVRLSGLAVDLPQGTNPFRSVLGPDGNFWIAALGTLATQNRIVRVTPSGQQTSFVLPPERVPTDITVGPDGALWFPESASNSIGRLTTAGAYSSCPLPNAAANPLPYGIAAGPDGAIWFTERNAGAIGRLAGGNCTPQPLAAPSTTSTAPTDAVSPQISGLKLTPSAFRAAPAGASSSVKGKAALGSRVSFTLSEAAQVTFTVQKKAPGRKVGGKCKRPTPASAGKQQCVRFVLLKGAVGIAGRRGANSFEFRGRLGGKTLAPGGYLLSGVATDAARNGSRSVAKGFTILG
jgi:hypothetical protein